MEIALADCVSRPPTCGDDTCFDEYYRRLKFRRLFVMDSYYWWADTVRRGFKTPKHDSILSGHRWMMELWSGNEARFFEQFRMRKHVMAYLIRVIQSRYGFVPYVKVAVDESLAMFVLIVGHGMTYPIVAERLQHSGQTVSAHFHEMLDAFCRMAIDNIKPEDPYFEHVPAQLENDRRYFPYFEGCIGAIDGTHINLRLGDINIMSWINRHGDTSTNVLTIVDFNLCITYAKIGLEGSMHDSRILHRALADQRVRFPIPPEGKYYAADAGYPNIKGFLTPYKKTRYHLPDFRQAGAIRNREENFNYVHSSIRSMVERTFGILKERFKILRRMTKFDVKTQVRIIWATFALHNFLRRYDEDDLTLLGDIPEEFDDDDTLPHNVWDPQVSRDALIMDTLRNRIRDSLPVRRRPGN